MIEFLADKVKWVDSIWDAFHTLIRPVGAAIIGATAVGEASAESVIIALLCGGVALSGHSTKAGIRLLANHSPEPFSNIGLSLIEDVLVIGGTWFSLQYPYVMLAVVIVFSGIFLWFGPKALRLLRMEIAAILALLKKLFLTLKRYLFFRRHTIAVAGSDVAFNVATAPTRVFPTSLRQVFNDQMPVNYIYYIRDKFGLDGTQPRIRCVAGKGVKGLRHSIGYLTFTATEVVFVSRRLFRFRSYAIITATIDHVHFKKHLLLDGLHMRTDKKSHTFYFFKDVHNRAEMISQALQDHCNA